MNNSISAINSIVPKAAQEQLSATTKAEQSFGSMINSLIKQTSDAEANSNQAIHELETGKAESLHEVMLKVEEADLSLRMLVQMRNRAVSAYEEIMRMQI